VAVPEQEAARKATVLIEATLYKLDEDQARDLAQQLVEAAAWVEAHQ
jgi:hypothetical protein